MAASQVKRALISVYNKDGLLEFARGLDGLGIQLVSSGGTAAALRAGGLPVLEVAELTGYPELFEGRVKTLHPKIHGGILARRDDPADRRTMEQYAIGGIDLVCVSLYPFEQTVARPGCTLEEAIENIDVGGPTMIRAAAKNHKFVYTVTRVQQYAAVLRSLRERGCWIDGPLAEELAREAFAVTARYDMAVYRWMATRNGAAWPRRLFLEFRLGEVLRYGENPHQNGAVYWDVGRPTGMGRTPSRPGDLPDSSTDDGSRSGSGAVVRGRPQPSLSRARLLAGRELSYNNLHDADAGWRIAQEFSEPAAVVIKHANPCGAAVADDLAEAVERAILGDPSAAFGGIVACNTLVDLATAERLVRPGRFLEVVVAPAFAPEAVRRITEGPAWGRSVRLLAVGDDGEGSSGPIGRLAGENSGVHERFSASSSGDLHPSLGSMGGSGTFPVLSSQSGVVPAAVSTGSTIAAPVGSSSGQMRIGAVPTPPPLDIRRIGGGVLLQTADVEADDPARWRTVTARPPSAREAADLAFAWTIVRHVKSNAVLLVKDRMLIGVGAGQMKRSDSSSVAVRIAGDRARGAVAASDAFFPFRDGLDEVAKAGVTAVIQPGGSKRDEEVVNAADQQTLAMIFTGRRHFRH